MAVHEHGEEPVAEGGEFLVLFLIVEDLREQLGDDVIRAIPFDGLQRQIAVTQSCEVQDGRDFDSGVFVEFHERATDRRERFCEIVLALYRSAE